MALPYTDGCAPSGANGAARLMANPSRNDTTKSGG